MSDQPAVPPCPRMVEATLPSQLSHVTHWRENGTCSYCGSISPEMLFAAIEAGTAVLGATDKNYKLYVDLPNPKEGQPRISASTNEKTAPGPEWLPADAEAKAKWGLSDGTTFYVVRPDGPMWHAKFYFQHLSDDQKQRFVDLHNARRLKFHAGDGFYVLPFFMKRLA
jgi:hypothetical protein